MKKLTKIAIGLCLLASAVVSSPVSAQEACLTTVNAGAATVQTQMYEQGCMLLSFSAGIITRDYKFNCCGTSASIRINYNDWDAIRSAGKLDGLRYQLYKKEGDTYYMTFRKIVGTTVTSIAGEDMFK
jgi:hypothetical protein